MMDSIVDSAMAMFGSTGVATPAVLLDLFVGVPSVGGRKRLWTEPSSWFGVLFCVRRKVEEGVSRRLVGGGIQFCFLGLQTYMTIFIVQKIKCTAKCGSPWPLTTKHHTTRNPPNLPPLAARIGFGSASSPNNGGSSTPHRPSSHIALHSTQ